MPIVTMSLASVSALQTGWVLPVSFGQENVILAAQRVLGPIIQTA